MKQLLIIVLFLVIVVAVVSSALVFYLISLNPINIPVNDTRSCIENLDCVSATCCHPDSCINKEFKGVCNELCTQVCEGPLDCGAGHCGCVNGKCEVISGSE